MVCCSNRNWSGCAFAIVLAMIAAVLAAPGVSMAAAREAPPAPGAARLVPGSILLLEEQGTRGWSLTPAGRSWRGTLLRATGDSLWVGPADGTAPRPLAIADLRMVQVRGGRSHLAGALAGTVVGALIGAGAGAIAAAIIVAQDPHEDGVGFAFLFGPLIGVAIGAPTGGVAGGIRGLEYWERVY